MAMVNVTMNIVLLALVFVAVAPSVHGQMRVNSRRGILGRTLGFGACCQHGRQRSRVERSTDPEAYERRMACCFTTMRRLIARLNELAPLLTAPAASFDPAQDGGSVRGQNDEGQYGGRKQQDDDYDSSSDDETGLQTDSFEQNTSQRGRRPFQNPGGRAWRVQDGIGSSASGTPAEPSSISSSEDDATPVNDDGASLRSDFQDLTPRSNPDDNRRKQQTRTEGVYFLPTTAYRTAPGASRGKKQRPSPPLESDEETSYPAISRHPQVPPKRRDLRYKTSRKSRVGGRNLAN